MKRFHSRKWALSAFALGAGAFPLACGAATPAYTLRLSVATPPTSSAGEVGIRLATTVDRRTNGQLKIEVYPNGQLANQAQMLEELSTGVIDFAIQATAFLTPLFPQYLVFDAPFLFKNIAAAYRVLDGSIGNELFALLATRGVFGLGWGIGGFREFETTGKSIVAPEDIRGLRMRIAGSPIYVATYQALGAIPVTIDLTELYTALSQHTVDGADVDLDGFVSQKFYTIIKHVAISNHVLSVVPILGSRRKIEALPAAMQNIIREEAKSAASLSRKLASEETAGALQVLKQNGVTTTDIQYGAFRRVVDPVYAMLQNRLGGDLLDRVGRAAAGG